MKKPSNNCIVGSKFLLFFECSDICQSHLCIVNKMQLSGFALVVINNIFVQSCSRFMCACNQYFKRACEQRVGYDGYGGFYFCSSQFVLSVSVYIKPLDVFLLSSYFYTCVKQQQQRLHQQHASPKMFCQFSGQPVKILKSIMCCKSFFYFAHVSLWVKT